jgi:hypothetical protein
MASFTSWPLSGLFSSAVSSGKPFRNSGVVLAQQMVPSLGGDGIAERDDSLTGLAMQTIRRDTRFAIRGHCGFLPCAKGSALLGILRPRCPTQTGTFKMRSAKGLHQVHLAGLEPATFGSVDRCSIQLSYRCNYLCFSLLLTSGGFAYLLF